MKHIFFAFPAGTAGAALLVLRGSVVLFMIHAPAQFPSAPWIAVPSYGLAIAVALGFATRWAAGLCAALCAILIWRLEAAPVIDLLMHALAAGALAMIGPGAFSIDASLFGRRTIHLPH
jgi:uncharacterized membrane protein YphA (DoxX/SURF4 family)